ncbi:MAG: rod shape-determining protein RodA [Candidatus Omnitrophica bacterium CG11_big_fil_rev_8_21_14_0_20_63_9]|nr:MAG: rod shape-determining protein RodA [Candidatus Omnitrophica bacterium CG11_big_fil_rev_8_21_14_0_20_63_9]
MSALLSRATWFKTDRSLWLAGLGLTLISAAAMASATATEAPELARRHLVWIVLGILSAVLTARINYRRWLDLAVPAYVASVIALIVVLAAGAVRLGATRWLSVFGVSVQPSEVAKLTSILMLARYLSGQPRPLPRRALLVSLGLIALPAGLVFIQPDLGSASIFGAIWLGMVWVAGMSRRSLLMLVGAALVALPIGWHGLKDYQRDRLLVFMNPNADPLGAGYTILQSMIAIGSGQLWGRGWLAGPQNRLSFLPEHHSDFIFAVIGEEGGFLGCVAVIGLFGWLLNRVVRIGLSTADPQGQLLATGIFCWVAYQAAVNLGMVIGMLPVVGVPLPWISYGGSSMVTLWLALGLLQSIARTDAQ